MKYISTLILLSASVTSAFAEDFIITQTNSIQKFTPAQDKENVKDFDIYYAGTDGTRNSPSASYNLTKVSIPAIITSDVFNT